MWNKKSPAIKYASESPGSYYKVYVAQDLDVIFLTSIGGNRVASVEVAELENKDGEKIDLDLKKKTLLEVNFTISDIFIRSYENKLIKIVVAGESLMVADVDLAKRSVLKMRYIERSPELFFSSVHLFSPPNSSRAVLVALGSIYQTNQPPDDLLNGSFLSRTESNSSTKRISPLSMLQQKQNQTYLFFYDLLSTNLLFALSQSEPGAKDIILDVNQTQFCFALKGGSNAFYSDFSCLLKIAAEFSWKDEVEHMNTYEKLGCLERNGPSFGPLVGLKLLSDVSSSPSSSKLTIHETGVIILWDHDSQVLKRIDLCCGRFWSFRFADTCFFASFYDKVAMEHQIYKIDLLESVEPKKEAGFAAFHSRKPNEYSRVVFIGDKVLHVVTQKNKEAFGSRFILYQRDGGS